MEIVTAILTVLFAGLVIAATITFGAALFLFILGIAGLVALSILIRGLWYRWRFLRSGSSRSSHTVVTIVEGDYKDISDSPDNWKESL